MFCTGGYDRGECLSTVESYDVVTNCWSTLKPMLVARGRFAATVLNGKLYACGGSNGQADLKSVECYDPATNSWAWLKDMTCHRTSAGKIYACSYYGFKQLLKLPLWDYHLLLIILLIAAIIGFGPLIHDCTK